MRELGGVHGVQWVKSALGGGMGWVDGWYWQWVQVFGVAIVVLGL